MIIHRNTNTTRFATRKKMLDYISQLDQNAITQIGKSMRSGINISYESQSAAEKARKTTVHI